MTTKNTKKSEPYKKYLKKKDIARAFGYSSINSFCNSTAESRVIDGVNALIGIIEGKIIEGIKGKG